jgi:HK97 family phage portal protein
MPRPKATATRPTRRTPSRPRKPATHERMISVLGTLLEPSPWGRLTASDVTPEVAIRVSAIFAVCRFIGQGVGVMPIQIGRTLPNGRKERFSPPCSYTIRSRPNAWQSRFDFMTLQAYWCALHGNGFARVIPGDRGWMTQLIPMHPTRVSVEQLADYSIQYKFLDSSARWIPLRQQEVLHWRWMSENGIWGMAPSEICATSISLARQLDIAATAFWKNGARPDFLIKTAEKISDPAIAELREQFRQMYGGNNRGAPGVVSSKVDVIPMQSNTMEQSQYQELRAAILPDVCRHWGVPSTLLGDAKMARYSNVEQEHLSAQVWCLLPWQHRMEGPLDMALQPVYGEDVYCKLDSRGLLRGDNASRAALYQSLFNMGGLRPNELRDLEDFELLDDPSADQTYMQLGFSTLANAASAGMQPAASDTVPQPAADATSSDHVGESVDEAGGFTVGQYVYWDNGEGVIEHLMVEGVLGVEGSPFAIQATPDAPAASVRVYQDQEPTEFTVGKRVSELSADPPQTETVQ